MQAAAAGGLVRALWEGWGEVSIQAAPARGVVRHTCARASGRAAHARAGRRPALLALPPHLPPQ